MTGSNVLIKTENITHVYGKDTPFEKTALSEVSIEILENDFLAVIGQTGSGKSTLVQHLNGLMKPDSGFVTYQGTDIWSKHYNRQTLRSCVGMVFQYPEHQLFEETVRKDIEFGPKNMGLDEEERKKRCEEAFHFVGLSPELGELSPFDLSGGQKRRVAIAGVMAMHPKVLILDEPTAGLDPKGREEILQGIVRYQKETGAAIILVSHSMEDVIRYASRVAIMSKGELIKIGKTKEVFSDSEYLDQIGLELPCFSQILHDLNKDGYGFDTDLSSAEEVAKAILEKIRNKGEIC